MRTISVKKKITLLLTLLMTTLAIFMIVLMLIVSNTVAMQTARKQLTDTLRSNLSYIEMTDRKAVIQDGFSYSHNGVSTLVYNQKKALIAGQIPVAFQTETDFENGVIRRVNSENTEYLVLDLWIEDGWEQGLWIRGLMEAPNQAVLSRNLFIVAAVTLPVFILLAAIGSYRITKKSFRPLDQINAAAEAIHEAKDLSGRIGLSQGNDEFSRLAGNFDRMFERLEKSFEAEKQFTSDASHELRTPISIIKGACEYAMKYEETPEERAETISMIYRQSEKMSTLVAQLLSMTRMEQGVEQVLMEVFDLSQFVQRFGKEQCWDESRICIDASEPCIVKGNEALLGRLIQNLVENAMKYSPEDTMVRVSLTANEEEVRLSVEDQGIGIREEDREKIWQRFYQVDSSHGGSDGSGLGLAMVQQIATLHGGRMSLESTFGKGSVFSLKLPRKKFEN